MHAASLPHSPLPGSTADRVIRVAGMFTIAYLVAGVGPLVLHARASADWRPLAAHLLVLVAAALVMVSHRAWLRPVRDWLPLALGPFLYVELRWLIEGMGRPHADAVVQGWERALFPGAPAATWAASVPVRWISEALHVAYASYYLLVYLPPAILYARGRRQAYAATLLALALVYAACFTAYLFFPVDGPRFLVGPAAAPDGPVRAFVLHLLDVGSSRGTAFPSSHVAASLVASLSALRHQPRIGIVVSIFTVGLAAATVYGGFHYAVDAMAGGMVGLAAWLSANALCRALSWPGAQRASAP